MYYDHKVKSLHIMPLKASYDGQIMYFLIEDDDLLEKYNTIFDTVSADI